MNTILYAIYVWVYRYTFFFIYFKSESKLNAQSKESFPFFITLLE